MNGIPSPRRGWRAAHKKEKNYHRYDSEYASYQRRKSREKIASIRSAPRCYSLLGFGPAGGQKIHDHVSGSRLGMMDHFQSEQASLTGN